MSSSEIPSKTPQFSSSESLFKDPIEELSSNTPEKMQQHTCKRGVALLLKGETARRKIEFSLELLEKYENLGEFFDSLDSSIRLLRLKGSMTSFTNIRPKIETLTDRRFTYGHLAQLKFILPEAIAIKKILVFDARTSCMKPDLHVTINPDAVEFDAKMIYEPGTMSMRKLFRARLKDFRESHPKGDEIPEEILPEPFGRPKHDPLLHMFKAPLTFSAVTLSTSDNAVNTDPGVSVPNETSFEALNQPPALASHMSQSFRRRFSRRVKENVHPKFPSDSFQPSAVPLSESSMKMNSISETTLSHQKTSPAELVSEASTSEACPSSVTPATPSKTIECADSKVGCVEDISTPLRFVSTPSQLMSATPGLKPPKRPSIPYHNSASSLDKLVKRPPPSRSLNFDTPEK